MIKTVPNYPNYKVSVDGTIIGKRGKPMKGCIDHCGYLEVTISCYPQKSKRVLVHRLILSTFKPVENMENLQVNHINGIKTDNRLDNLEWCTRSENLKHAYKMGLEKRMLGEKHHSHKLTVENVKYIKKHYVKYHKQYGATALARKFNVDRTTVSDVVNGKTWKEVCI